MVKQIKRTRREEDRVPRDYDDDTSLMSFPDFWDSFCKHPASTATNTFYAGTMALLISVVTLITSQLYYQYHSPQVAIAFASMCMACSLIAFYYHCRFSSNKGLHPPKRMGPRLLEKYLSHTLSAEESLPRRVDSISSENSNDDGLGGSGSSKWSRRKGGRTSRQNSSTTSTTTTATTLPRRQIEELPV